MKPALDTAGTDWRLGDLAPRVARGAAAVGLAGLLACVPASYLTADGVNRFWHAYLVSFAYFLSLALGALFFVLLQHLTRAGWSVVLRRLAEALAGTLPLLALLCVPLLIGMRHLYHWADADAAAQDALLQWKRPYLNVPFFVARLAVYFAVWVGLARFFFNSSVRQDASGDVHLTLRMQQRSAPAMVAYGLTVTFAAIDLLMSLDAHWYSTIFGIYYFSGAVLGSCALLVVAVALVQRGGRLRRAITAEHLHDLGKLIFAFTVFWAYIAFSQYLLIWYANIPEETVWYLRRQSGGWAAVSLTLLLGHFLVPFLLLLSRWAKRRRPVLVAVAAWVLVLHWVDIYWLVLPGASPQHAWPQLPDLACLVGVGGLFAAAAAYRLRRCALLPLRDPRLAESLRFENV